MGGRRRRSGLRNTATRECAAARSASRPREIKLSRTNERALWEMGKGATNYWPNPIPCTLGLAPAFTHWTFRSPLFFCGANLKEKETELGVQLRGHSELGTERGKGESKGGEVLCTDSSSTNKLFPQLQANRINVTVTLKGEVTVVPLSERLAGCSERAGG